jgi:1-acyl-sn-glycerol-3-phosphate acyltransferase
VKHELHRDLTLSGDRDAWRWRPVLQFILSGPLRALFRLRASGIENLPAGACIFCGNHVSYFDSILLFALMRRYKLKIRFVAKQELYRFRLFSWALDEIGALPVARGTADRRMIQRASAALAAGDSLSVFPEGTRQFFSEEELAARADHLGEAQGGAAYLALRNKVPVIPVGIAGTERIKPPGAKLPRLPAVDIHFGPPIDPGGHSGTRKEQMAALTAAIMEEIGVQLAIARADNLSRRHVLSAAGQTEEAS